MSTPPSIPFPMVIGAITLNGVEYVTKSQLTETEARLKVALDQIPRLRMALGNIREQTSSITNSNRLRGVTDCCDSIHGWVSDAFRAIDLYWAPTQPPTT